jgi:protocatechuate 3,4-dioxygenase beta subunit
VKEAKKIPYYIDNYTFSDDPTLKEEDINVQKNRGGYGLLDLKEQDGILTGHRDIILGLNIPDYEK